jgi:hypothetical protein
VKPWPKRQPNRLSASACASSSISSATVRAARASTPAELDSLVVSREPGPELRSRGAAAVQRFFADREDWLKRLNAVSLFVATAPRKTELDYAGPDEIAERLVGSPQFITVVSFGALDAFLTRLIEICAKAARDAVHYGEFFARKGPFGNDVAVQNLSTSRVTD